MEHHAGLLHGAQHIAAGDLVARFGHGIELPFLFPVQGGHLYAAGQVVAPRLFHDAFQRTLDTVVNIFDDTGAQLHGHGRAGGLHRRAGAQAGGLLIDLDGRGVAVHGEDLTDQALLSHPDHVGHIGVLQPGGHHQRAGDFDDFSAQIDSTFFHVGGRGRVRAPAPAKHPASRSFRRRRRDGFVSRGKHPPPDYRISAPTARSTALFTLAIPMPRLPSLPGMRMTAGVSSSL